MSMSKFFVMAVFLVFLAGCTNIHGVPVATPSKGITGEPPMDCDAPNRPLNPACSQIALQISRLETDHSGPKFVWGFVPQAVIDDNMQRQTHCGVGVDYSDYNTMQNEYLITVRNRDIKDLKKGNIYLFKAKPHGGIGNTLLLVGPISEGDIKDWINKYPPVC